MFDPPQTLPRPWEVIGKKIYVFQKMSFFQNSIFLFFSKIKKWNFEKSRKMSRFRPSHYVERVRREISCLKSGLNISGVFSRPKLCHFVEF